MVGNPCISSGLINLKILIVHHTIGVCLAIQFTLNACHGKLCILPRNHLKLPEAEYICGKKQKKSNCSPDQEAAGIFPSADDLTGQLVVHDCKLLRHLCHRICGLFRKFLLRSAAIQKFTDGYFK